MNPMTKENTTTPPLHTILITGASSGLGAELAMAYSSPEHVLFLCGRNKERLEAVAQSCRSRGATVFTKIMDVTQSYAVRQWIKEADELYPLDLVIANAGISAGTGTKGTENEAQVREIMDINVTGVLNTIHPAIDCMVPRQHGQIAIVSSMAGFRGLPGSPAYSASKALVRTYGEGLRGTLAKHGVKVNVICPGFVDTPLTRINPYKMPFLMEATRAAVIIKNGLAKNKGRIAFPRRMMFIVWLLMVLPDCVVNRMLRNMPGKPEYHE